MSERGFDNFDLYGILEAGYVDGKIDAGKNPGEWKVKLVGSVEGSSRKMGVVVTLPPSFIQP